MSSHDVHLTTPISTRLTVSLCIIHFILLQVACSVNGIPFHIQTIDRYDAPWTDHVTDWTDVNTEYRLVYTTNGTNSDTPQCPNALLFGLPNVDAEQVGRLGMASISQDGFFCAGPEPLVIVQEAVVRDPGGLSNLGLDQFRQGLDGNRVASALASHNLSTSMLIGWHSSFRACGAIYYPQDTFYFFIREESGFRISFPVSPDVQDIVSIPPNMQALAVVPPNGPVCLLVNPLSAPDSYVTLSRASPSGQSSPTVLMPSQNTGPTPSISPSPQSANSSPSPPTVQIPPPNVSALPQSSFSTTPAPSIAANSVQPSISIVVDSPSVSPNDVAPSTPLPTVLNTIAGASYSSSAPVESDDIGSDGGGSTVSESDEPDGNAVCFPGTASVTLASGQVVPMHMLQVGDVVLTPEGPSPIILFTHRLPRVAHHFVRLVTANGSVTLTAEHYVPLWRGGLRRAADVACGDWLLCGVNALPVQVKTVDAVCANGLYNPQTRAGLIIIDGFVASTYTTAIDPLIAHGPLLAPIRALFRVASWTSVIISEFFSSGAPLLTALLPTGQPLIAAQ